MPAKTTNRPLFIFFFFCILFSWPIFFLADGWLGPMFSQQNNFALARLSVLIGHMLAMLGPAISAWIMWRFYYKEVPPNWRRSLPKYYLWIVLAAIAFWTLPGIITLFLGDKIVSPIDPSIWIFIALIIIFGWITGMGEEVGWCAYLLPKLSQNSGKARALIVSNVLRGLWHWPVLITPVILQVIAGEHTVLELVGAGIVIAFQLILSNLFFGSVFGWIWYQTESIPLVGWLHYWYDMVRDITIVLLAGYGSSLWVTMLNPFFLYPIAFLLFYDVLVGEGLNWKTLFVSKKSEQPEGIKPE